MFLKKELIGKRKYIYVVEDDADYVEEFPTLKAARMWQNHWFEISDWYDDKLPLINATTKRKWQHLMCLDGAKYLPNLFAKPIQPTMKNWRKLRRALIKSDYQQKPGYVVLGLK